MIFLDTTKAAKAGHRSGLVRVTTRLAAELGPAATAVQWPLGGNSAPAAPGAMDWFLSAELFSEAERPGLTAFLDAHRHRTAAIFHDAIPLKHPHITWPQSVARHPGYMKLLAKFDRVWAVSRASKDELEGFWRWQGVAHTPAVDVLALGADFNGAPRATRNSASAAPPRILCVGIFEPRKNQAFLVDVCEQLWSDGQRFELHLVGRENPHFGAPIVRRIKAASRRWPELVKLHLAPSDDVLAELYRTARVTVFPTIAEGCGLPLLESLWLGLPCVCSDLPVLRENASEGGCLPVPVNDRAAWADALRRVLTDEALVARLIREATTRPLPTWADTAAAVRRGLA